MTQAHPVPDVHARGSLAVENVPAGAVALIGSSKGHDQIQLRAGIDDPADAAKNPIHFAKRSETIDVNRLQAGGLRQQFFVQHDGGSPHWWKHHSDTTSSGSQQFCDRRIQNVIGRSALRTHSEFIGAHPDEATAIYAPNPTPVIAVAAIPEADTCGFEFDINSIPDNQGVDA